MPGRNKCSKEIYSWKRLDKERICLQLLSLWRCQDTEAGRHVKWPVGVWPHPTFDSSLWSTCLEIPPRAENLGIIYCLHLSETEGSCWILYERNPTQLFWVLCLLCVRNTTFDSPPPLWLLGFYSSIGADDAKDCVSIVLQALWHFPAWGMVKSTDLWSDRLAWGISCLTWYKHGQVNPSEETPTPAKWC